MAKQFNAKLSAGSFVLPSAMATSQSVFNIEMEAAGATFAASISSNSKTFDAEQDNIVVITDVIGGEVYAGAYDVTPRTASQTLQTKDKLLLDDVTVSSIPYYETSNTAGGKTAYIGSDVTWQ